MNHTIDHSRSQILQDQFGRRVAARLDAANADLPHDISERLRAARVRAVAQRKVERMVQPAAVVVGAGGTLALGSGDEGLSFWNRIASALPLIALVFGLVTIHSLQNEYRAHEVAEVDAALLTDDLPPSAYADPGFAQFLKSDRE